MDKIIQEIVNPSSDITFTTYPPFHEPNHIPESSSESDYQKKVRETFNETIKHYSEELKEPFTCKHCKKTPNSLSGVLNHLRYCYNTDIECPVCVPAKEANTTKTSKLFFKLHMRKIKMTPSDHRSITLHYIGKVDLEVMNMLKKMK
jgi:hypothetical protein